MKMKIILSALMAALLPGLALAQAQAGKGPRQVDANGDGVITQSEATDAGATRLIEVFDEIDADGNGELTREERQAYRQERRQEGRQEGRKRAQSADTDGNGALSLDEAKAAKMQRLVEHFSTLDQNGDGEVSREEMQAMRQDKRSKQKGQQPGQGRAANAKPGA